MRRRRQPKSLIPLRLISRHRPDSDESISDEDDAVFPNNALSSDNTHKQELPLAVRLDILKGISDRNLSGKGTSSSSEKPLEDEVEMPDFNEGEVVANSTDEENNSADRDNTAVSAPQLRKYGPQSIRNKHIRDMTRISEALLHYKGSMSGSHMTCSKANISVVDPRSSGNLEENHLEDDDKIEVNSDIEPDETEAFPREFNLTSMNELFDNLQDKANQLLQKSSRPHLKDTTVDSEDFSDPVESGSSSDNKASYQQIKNAFSVKKTQTMTERFLEALGTSSVITEGTRVGAHNSLSDGLSERLQQMMLKEKETDMDFWKKLKAGARPDSQLGCFDVKIISRYHDGKLTVCHCSFGKCRENFLLQDNYEGMGFGGSQSSQSTIIFSPRVCNNVDLVVGNVIRIHPPWKEVQVGNDNIILCTYFSLI
ncbi:uncharacterized protein HKW66_Vig0182680 [Vigna angularis]|uniref:Uncharacterized protein n=1 Tax=Phaseolus angularis TaxID=3914 RepID=A0A8T0K3W6_PHAAN|nr:uncharacterized protein LOC108319802 isoform X3 [Vigna angularis]KAG2394354.1 uncharacterized protein HKW66_Vig0182680 [Vigna angularis]